MKIEMFVVSAGSQYATSCAHVYILNLYRSLLIQGYESFSQFPLPTLLPFFVLAPAPCTSLCQGTCARGKDKSQRRGPVRAGRNQSEGACTRAHQRLPSV
jgi:hypothetical protein